MSTFAVVQQANGQLCPIIGTLMEIGATKLNTNQKLYCGCKITDTTGVNHSVTIHQGTGQLPTTNDIGKSCRWSISTYQGQRGLAYGGFFNGLDVQRPALPPQAPQPQKPQPAGKSVPYTDNNTYIVAECAAKIVGDWVVAATITPDKFDWEIIRVSNAIWGAAIKLQNWKPPRQPVTELDEALGQEPPPQDEGDYSGQDDPVF